MSCITGLLAGASALAAMAGASAATAADTSSANTAAADSARLDEVVVTAMKRTERAQDVGATIEAVGAERVRTSRVVDLTDLSAMAPSVDIKETVPGALPTVTIRGIGLDDFSSTSSPAAGVYLDEIPLSSPALMSGDFLDLGRIEVLKGPQGTLYGRNTTAGAINIISERPKDQFGAYAKVGYGNYNAFEAEGDVNIPLSDTLDARLSGKTIQQGTGYWRSDLLANGQPGSRSIGQRHVWLGRAQLLWKPTSAFDLNLKIEGERSRSEIGVPQNFGAFTPGAPFVPCAPVLAGHLDNSQCVDAYGYQNTHSNPYRGDWAGSFPYNINQFNTTATAHYRADGWELTSITGYIRFSRLYHIDVDSTPLNEFDFIENEAVRQFTQEFRLAKSFGPVDAIAGAFGSWDHVLGDNTNDLQDWPLLLLGAAPGTGKTTYDQITHSAAIYGNATWHVTHQLELIGGLRYTAESRHYVGGTIFDQPSPAVGVTDAFINDHISDRNVTWKVGANYHLSPQAMLYGSISQGVKSGGFFSGFANNVSQLLPYRPERLTAYEAGAKTQVIRNLTFNASVFYYHYADPQTFVRFVDPITGLSVQKVGNIDWANAYGADLDAVWRPVEGLTLTGGLGLLHTELSSFTTTAGVVPAGNRLPNAPTVSFSGSARYEHALARGYRGYGQVEVHASGAVFKEASNDPLIAAGSYALVNLRLAVIDPTGRWEAAIWGKNVGNKLYEVQGDDLSSLGIVNKNYNAPRTFGAEISYRY